MFDEGVRKEFWLVAHRYFLAEGEMATELTFPKGESACAARSFEELTEKVITFGQQHAPCNVLVRCTSWPVPVGFAEWNDNLSAFTFDNFGKRLRFKDGVPIVDEQKPETD